MKTNEKYKIFLKTSLFLWNEEDWLEFQKFSSLIKNSQQMCEV
jgi:hypothetical protein